MDGGDQNRFTMKNKTLLALAVALGATFATVARADPPAAAAAARAAAAAASSPSAQLTRALSTPMKPAAVPRLELKLPSAPAVICACVRLGERA